MRYITLAIAFLICISAEAQVIRAEPFYIAPEAGVTNLLLDDYPGAAVAYSLRKLDKDYTGSAIRVRRSNDNTEQDIGFLSSGYLDTAAMKTFVGNNNGFVVTWYIQADSSGVFGLRNATQSIAASQPRIISAGNLYYKNGEVALEFNVSSLLITINASPFATNAAVFALSSVDDQNTTDRIYDLNRNPDYQLIQFYDSSADSIKSYSRQRTIAEPFTSYGSQTLSYLGLNSSNLSIAINGGSLKSISYSAGIASPGIEHAIGSNRNNTGNYIKGGMFELIAYGTDQSSNRTAIRDNINSFYSIY